MNAPHSTLARDLAAAMDWWRDAGVDMDFADDATSWLAEEANVSNHEPISGQATGKTKSARAERSSETPKKETEITRVDLLGDSPPDTLDAFRTFWAEAPGLDAIGPRGRIMPRGPANAELMVLVVDPEEVDRETLLSGAQGKLLDRMLKAMSVDVNQVYFASALPRHTPIADTSTIASSGMDAVVRKHIQLAAPKRIIAFGSGILPLLGHDQSQDIMSLREINHDTSSTPLLVSEGLDSMMSMPRLKARFWRRWMEWSL